MIIIIQTKKQQLFKFKKNILNKMQQKKKFNQKISFLSLSAEIFVVRSLEDHTSRRVKSEFFYTTKR